MLTRLCPFFLALSLVCPGQAQNYRLTILHTNDIHAHIEPTKLRNGDYGGYARLATLVKTARATEKNPILLSAGDTFQGTLFFNVYEGLADLAFMDLMGYDAMALGNHEFDRGPKTLAPFIKLASFPVLSANIDVSLEPLLKDLVKPSTILNVGGEKIGVVGAVTPDLPTISSPGPNVKMLDLLPSIQKEVDALIRRRIDKVIVLSHCGYDLEKEMAAKLRGVDVIVGGHSHSLLGTFTNPDFPPTPGPYPTVVKNLDGGTTLVVQSWDWGKVFGKLGVEFDSAGKVLSWTKDQPRTVDSTVPDDLEAAALVAAFKKPIAAMASEVVGSTDTGINQTGENLMACVIADGQLAACKEQSPDSAFMNRGGVRSSIEPGTITFGEAVQVQPFNNTLVAVELTGEEIKKSLEWGVRQLPDYPGGMLYVSKGSSYEVDVAKPVGERVSNVVIGDKQLEPSAVYLIAMSSFVAGGGDGHAVIKSAKGKRTETGIMDIDAFVDYLKANKPLNPKEERRIKIKAPLGLPQWLKQLDFAGMHVVNR